MHTGFQALGWAAWQYLTNEEAPGVSHLAPPGVDALAMSVSLELQGASAWLPSDPLAPAQSRVTIRTWHTMSSFPHDGMLHRVNPIVLQAARQSCCAAAAESPSSVRSWRRSSSSA